MKVLTTGVNSGIGRYIHEHLDGPGLHRATPVEEWDKIRKDGVDIIVHCAFNSERDVTQKSLYDYMNDNVMLTRELVSVPHKKFIFFSTVDLYPKNGSLHSEAEIIHSDNVQGMYAVSKLMSECIVRAHSREHMIIRPTTLVGRYSRKNTLMRLIEGRERECYLTGDSSYNYVLHSDVLEFIRLAINNDVRGIYNIASSGNILLSEAAAMLGRNVRFGSHRYDVGNIANDKAAGVLSAFKKTSSEVLRQFAGEYANA